VPFQWSPCTDGLVPSVLRRAAGVVFATQIWLCHFLWIIAIVSESSQLDSSFPGPKPHVSPLEQLTLYIGIFCTCHLKVPNFLLRIGKVPLKKQIEDWRCGSSGGVLNQQEPGPEFNSQYPKKKKN
jgi:hypothetical protein